MSVFEGHTHLVHKIIELHNGNLASCSLDRTINIWDRHTGEIINTLEGFESDIKDIQEVDSNNLAILNFDDNTFMIWNYKKELEDNCLTYEEHEDAINKIIVVNHKYIFSGSSDCTVKKWSIKSNRRSEATYHGHSGPITDVIFLDNKQFASASGDKTIKIWEVSTKFNAYTLEGHSRPVTQLQYLHEF